MVLIFVIIILLACEITTAGEDNVSSSTHICVLAYINDYCAQLFTYGKGGKKQSIPTQYELRLFCCMLYQINP